MWHPDSMTMAVISSIVFGLVGICLTLLGFKLFDVITPGIKLEHELADKQNMAVAIVVASLILGMSVILASIIGG